LSADFDRFVKSLRRVVESRDPGEWVKPFFEKPLAVEVLAALPAWRPIATAPRDGSVFILGWPGGRAPGFWCQSFGRFSVLPSDTKLPPGKIGGFYPFDEWTHWQPLPAAPEAES
jgi:hypothetical protein